MAKEFMSPHKELLQDFKEGQGERDGVAIEKGVVIGEEFLEKYEEQIKKKLEFWTSYPDLFLDEIQTTEENFTLYFYQRIFLRACMRYQEVYICAARAFSKSFLSILAIILQCIFMPGTKRFIVAPHKNQAAGIARQKIEEIYRLWPALRREVVGWELAEYPGNFGKDYVTLRFRNGSQFDVVGGDGARGLRRHGGLLDELRDADETEIQEVIIPLMNIARSLPDGKPNPREINRQQIIATSASTKSSYAYIRLKDCLMDAIMMPDYAFVMGCDYRVPMLHGLLDKKSITNLKLSPSYNEDAFNREYLSNWSAASEESWFNFDKLEKYRKLKNPDLHKKDGLKPNQFYLLSADVGRLHDQTVVTVYRVNVQTDGRHLASVVNIIVLGRTPETKPFRIQAIDLKRIIRDYQPKDVVIDCNGLGVGLADEMIQEQMDEFGEVYPAYGFYNNDDYKKVQPKNAICILYSMKANGPLKSKINGNAYARCSNGSVRFLITEQEARSALLATKIGQKMNTRQRVERLMPHEMTTKLFLEMANLRLKTGGSSMDIVLESINSSYPDDKYYSFAYGLWRIKELEEVAMKKRSRRSSGPRRLVFYN